MFQVDRVTMRSNEVLLSIMAADAPVLNQITDLIHIVPE